VDISENKLPKWWKEPRQQPISAQLLSISTGWFIFLTLKHPPTDPHIHTTSNLQSIWYYPAYSFLFVSTFGTLSVITLYMILFADDKFSSSWGNIQGSEVEVLVLNFQTKNYALPKFVGKMDELKVLIVTNYGFFHAELGNFQLLESLSCLKKIRLEKVSILSLFKSPVQLRSLEKISLFMCNISQAFRNCTIQVSDAFPNLKEINIDYCNDLTELPVGLCDIICLKKLSITNCLKLSALPQEIEKLVNLEVLRLRSTSLEQLPESITSLSKLSILDISDCPEINKLPIDIGNLCNLEKLNMKGCLRLHKQLPPSTSNLEKLKLVICDKERAKLWEPIKEFCTSLKIKLAEKDINLHWLPNRS
jgi:hypothetical protein